MTEPTPPFHLRVRGKIDQATERLALRATLTAAHLLGLATGSVAGPRDHAAAGGSCFRDLPSGLA